MCSLIDRIRVVISILIFMRTYRSLLFVLLLTIVSNITVAQTWHYTGSLSQAKRTGTLTTLPNAKAIYIGGTDASGRALNTCELYDPAIAGWTQAASMVYARERHTSTLLSVGRLMVIAGNGSFGVTGSIEIYDYATDSWSDGGMLLVPRQNHTSTLLQDGSILITGGYSGGSIINECEIYDPSTATSKKVASLLTARMDHSATILDDGRVLITSGRNGEYFTECEIYDPTLDTWSVAPTMHQARLKGSLITFSDGTVLASGGRNTANSSAAGSEILQVPFTSWNSTSPMYQPVHWNSNTLLSHDRFLVTGGLIDAEWGNDFTAVTTPTCEWYDKKNSRWYYAPELNQKRSYHEACVIHQTVNDELPQDMVLVASGLISDYKFTATTEYLDITEQALKAYMIMPSNMACVSSPGSEWSCNIEMNGGIPTLQLSLPEAASMHYEISSASGFVASHQTSLTLEQGDYNLSISDHLSPGFYFIRLSAGDRSAVRKFAILR
jgi:hypothetical protein